MNTQIEMLKASKNPHADINRVAYQGQDPLRRQYKQGYEDFFNNMPKFNKKDPLAKEKMIIARSVMKKLVGVIQNQPWIEENMPTENNFDRFILGIEPPKTTQFLAHDNESIITMSEGAEIVLARWGKGHSSPVHGHASGYLHEELISGKLLVNLFRITDGSGKQAVPIRSDIFTSGTIASLYTEEDIMDLKRGVLVHNFVALEPSITLHFLPEHTRDGRDNVFYVSHWDQYLTEDSVTQLDYKAGMYLQKGDVCLVRSSNVPDYKDHYIVVTGAPIMKEHGMRPQEVAISAGILASRMLDNYTSVYGLILLKLKEEERKAFLNYHNIIVKDEVIFPDAI